MHSPVSRLIARFGAVMTAIVIVSCSRRALVPRPESIVNVVSPCSPQKERLIGEPRMIENVTVYPITSCAQVDVGPIVTLDEALAKGTATIHELEGGGSVNKLVIENTGTIPIFVLAGTIVKGGKQDRQIGQDYLLGAKEKSDVDAFCVEHGRWNDIRNGAKTDGLFGVADVIATSKVRVAGQYEKNQGKVWAKVAETNSANAKKPASDTLMASIDDAALTKERDALADRLGRALASITPRDSMIGFAYAIDGEIRGARWFAHHSLYAMHEQKLLRSIAVDAALARAEAKAEGKVVSASPPPKAEAVEAFLAAIDQQNVVEERDTTAENVNEYKESPKAYGSKLKLKMGKPGAVGTTASSAAKKPLSSDVTAK
jgi:hypothetical protein